MNDYLTAYKASDVTLELIQTLNDDQIYTALFGEKPKGSSRPLPDFTKMHTELKKKHVTRSLLWEEYREQHPDGLWKIRRLSDTFWVLPGIIFKTLLAN